MMNTNATNCMKTGPAKAEILQCFLFFLPIVLRADKPIDTLNDYILWSTEKAQAKPNQLSLIKRLVILIKSNLSGSGFAKEIKCN